MYVTKPYEFIGFGAMYVTKPYEFIGFGAMDDTDTSPAKRDLILWRRTKDSSCCERA